MTLFRLYWIHLPQKYNYNSKINACIFVDQLCCWNGLPTQSVFDHDQKFVPSIQVLITLDQTSYACDNSHKQCSRYAIPEEHNLHFPSSIPLFCNQAPPERDLWLHNHKNDLIFSAIFVAHNCF